MSLRFVSKVPEELRPYKSESSIHFLVRESIPAPEPTAYPCSEWFHTANVTLEQIMHAKTLEEHIVPTDGAFLFDKMTEWHLNYRNHSAVSKQLRLLVWLVRMRYFWLWQRMLLKTEANKFDGEFLSKRRLLTMHFTQHRGSLDRFGLDELQLALRVFGASITRVRYDPRIEDYYRRGLMFRVATLISEQLTPEYANFPDYQDRQQRRVNDRFLIDTERFFFHTERIFDGYRRGIPPGVSVKERETLVATGVLNQRFHDWLETLLSTPYHKFAVLQLEKIAFDLFLRPGEREEFIKTDEFADDAANIVLTYYRRDQVTEIGDLLERKPLETLFARGRKDPCGSGALIDPLYDECVMIVLVHLINKTFEQNFQSMQELSDALRGYKRPYLFRLMNEYAVRADDCIHRCDSVAQAVLTWLFVIVDSPVYRGELFPEKSGRRLVNLLHLFRKLFVVSDIEKQKYASTISTIETMLEQRYNRPKPNVQLPSFY